MAYLIGKIFLEPGSVCLKVNHGSELSRFREEISEKFEDIELITLSNPEAFPYGPYQYVDTCEKFESKLADMAHT